MLTIKEWQKQAKAITRSGGRAPSFFDWVQGQDPQRYAIPTSRFTGRVANPPPPANGRAASRNMDIGTQVRTSNIYTPEAQADLASVTQTSYKRQPPGLGGTYWDGDVYGGINRIELDPSAGPEVARHEYGHFFDDQRGITAEGSRYGWPDLPKFAAMYPGGGAGQMGALRENAFLGTVLAQQRTDPTAYKFKFPGMFGRPPERIVSTGQQWGGRSELYAHLNENPGNIAPDLRKFFPQFAPAAYQPPPGMKRVTVRYEDGSVGDTLIPIRNKPGRWR